MCNYVLLLLLVINIGLPLFWNFSRTFVCVCIQVCGIVWVLQSLVIGIPLSYWFHPRACACMRVRVCVFVWMKRVLGFSPIHSDTYHQRLKKSVFADFWKARDGRTGGRTDRPSYKDVWMHLIRPPLRTLEAPKFLKMNVLVIFFKNHGKFLKIFRNM